MLCSPDFRKLCSSEELLVHLTTEGTCKCGLRCPFHLEQQFSFNPLVISLEDSSPLRDELTPESLCKAAHMNSHHVPRVSSSVDQLPKNSSSPPHVTRSPSQHKNGHQQVTYSSSHQTVHPSSNFLGPVCLPTSGVAQKRPALTANMNLGNTAKRTKVHSPSLSSSTPMVVSSDGRDAKQQARSNHCDDGARVLLDRSSGISKKKKKKRTVNTGAISKRCGSGNSGEGIVGGAVGGARKLATSPSTSQPTIVLDEETHQKLLYVLSTPKLLSRLSDVNFYVTVKEQLNNAQQKIATSAKMITHNENAAQTRDSSAHGMLPVGGATLENKGAFTPPPTSSGAHNNHKSSFESHPLLSFTHDASEKIGNILGRFTTSDSPSFCESIDRHCNKRQARLSPPPPLSEASREEDVDFISFSSPSSPVPLKGSPPICADPESYVHDIIQVEMHAPISGISHRSAGGGGDENEGDTRSLVDSSTDQKEVLAEVSHVVVLGSPAYDKTTNAMFKTSSESQCTTSSLCERPFVSPFSAVYKVASSATVQQSSSHTFSATPSISSLPHHQIVYNTQSLSSIKSSLQQNNSSLGPRQTSLSVSPSSELAVEEGERKTDLSKERVHNDLENGSTPQDDEYNIAGDDRMFVVKETSTVWTERENEEKKRDFGEGLVTFDESDEEVEIESLMPIIERSITRCGLECESLELKHIPIPETNSSNIVAISERARGEDSYHIPNPSNKDSYRIPSPIKDSYHIPITELRVSKFNSTGPVAKTKLTEAESVSVEVENSSNLDSNSEETIMISTSFRHNDGSVVDGDDFEAKSKIAKEHSTNLSQLDYVEDSGSITDDKCDGSAHFNEATPTTNDTKQLQPHIHLSAPLIDNVNHSNRQDGERGSCEKDVNKSPNVPRPLPESAPLIHVSADSNTLTLSPSSLATCTPFLSTSLSVSTHVSLSPSMAAPLPTSTSPSLSTFTSVPLPPTTSWSTPLSPTCPSSLPSMPATCNLLSPSTSALLPLPSADPLPSPLPSSTCTSAAQPLPLVPTTLHSPDTSASLPQPMAASLPTPLFPSTAAATFPPLRPAMRTSLSPDGSVSSSLSLATILPMSALPTVSSVFTCSSPLSCDSTPSPTGVQATARAQEHIGTSGGSHISNNDGDVNDRGSGQSPRLSREGEGSYDQKGIKQTSLSNDKEDETSNNDERGTSSLPLSDSQTKDTDCLQDGAAKQVDLLTTFQPKSASQGTVDQSLLPVEPINIDIPLVDLTLGLNDRDDCSSSNSGIVTASARNRKEWSVVSSDSLSTGLFSRSSSCNLSDSFNSSDRFSLADSCNSLTDSNTPSEIASKNNNKIKRPSSFTSSWKQKRHMDPSFYETTKAVMTRSKLAKLNRVSDCETVLQALSPTSDSSNVCGGSSEGSESPPEYSMSKGSHKSGRSMSLSSLESSSSSSSVSSLQSDASKSISDGGNG